MFFFFKFYNEVIHQKDANTELNDLRKIICSRKSEITVERISVCNVNENLEEHGRHYLPCSYTNDVIQICYCNNYDVILMSKRRHPNSILPRDELNTPVCNSLSEMLPEIFIQWKSVIFSNLLFILK